MCRNVAKVIFVFRTAHERLFGTKAAPPENSEQNPDNPNFVNNKISSLDRHQNSKSVSNY